MRATPFFFIVFFIVICVGLTNTIGHALDHELMLDPVACYQAQRTHLINNAGTDIPNETLLGLCK